MNAKTDASPSADGRVSLLTDQHDTCFPVILPVRPLAEGAFHDACPAIDGKNGVVKEVRSERTKRWLTAILVNPTKNKGIGREDIRLALEADNIDARPLWKPMHLQPIFKSCPFYGDGTSEKLFENGLCLPSGSNLREDEFERIFRVLDGIFKSVRL